MRMPRKGEKAQLAQIQRELRAVVEAGVRSVADNLLTNLQASTPKDTGASSYSWKASNRPRGPVAKRTGAGVATAKAAQEASRANIAGFRLEQGRVFVGSPQPGIEQLNNGSSTKEPAAFVQRSIRKAVIQTRVRTLVIRR